MLCGPQINIKKLHQKKSKQSKLKSLPQVDFFIFILQFSTFHDSFKLVQRVFHNGSIATLEINLVPN